MFSAFTAGAFLFVTGLIGYDINQMHGTFQGGRWVDAPIWWQVLLGVALLLLGVYWSRRLEEPSIPVSPPSGSLIKNVGHGKTAGAAGRASSRF